MTRKKSRWGGYSVIFKELDRLKLELEIDSLPIKTDELNEIDDLRKVVIEVSKTPYIYCTTT